MAGYMTVSSERPSPLGLEPALTEPARLELEAAISDAYRNALIDLRDRGLVQQIDVTYLYEKTQIEITLPPRLQR